MGSFKKKVLKYGTPKPSYESDPAMARKGSRVKPPAAATTQSLFRLQVVYWDLGIRVLGFRV